MPSTAASAPSSSGAVDAPVQTANREPVTARSLASVMRLTSAPGTALGWPAPVNPLIPTFAPGGSARRASSAGHDLACQLPRCDSCTGHPPSLAGPGPVTVRPFVPRSACASGSRRRPARIRLIGRRGARVPKLGERRAHRVACSDLMVRLAALFQTVPAFKHSFVRTAWFGNEVLWLAPQVAECSSP